MAHAFSPLCFFPDASLPLSPPEAPVSVDGGSAAATSVDGARGAEKAVDGQRYVMRFGRVLVVLVVIL